MRLSFPAILLLGFAVAMIPAPGAFADTVYLKNGSAIDGTVLGSHEGVLILRIGNVGRTEIPEKDIENIEKNDRTGYVDPGRRVKKDQRITKEKGNDEENASTSVEEVDEVTVDPETEKEIRGFCRDLTRQKTTHRVRAERKLTSMGPVVVPYVLEYSRHSFVRTRVAVFRILKKHGADSAVQACLEGLEDDDRFVRRLAWEALRRISGKKWAFPWDDETSTDRQREKSARKWQRWAEREEARRAQEAEDGALSGGPDDR